MVRITKRQKAADGRYVTVMDSEDGWAITKYETLDDEGHYELIRMVLGFFGNPMTIEMNPDIVLAIRAIAGPVVCAGCGFEIHEGRPLSGQVCAGCIEKLDSITLAQAVHTVDAKAFFKLFEAFMLGAEECRSAIGMTYDGDPESDRSAAYDLGRSFGDLLRKKED